MTLSKLRDSLPEDEFKRVALKYLDCHKDVAWCKRMNTGTKGRVKFGFVGLSDIIGQMKDGRFIAIELKREIKLKKSIKRTKATEDQIKFIRSVLLANGVAGIAVSISDIDDILSSKNSGDYFFINC